MKTGYTFTRSEDRTHAFFHGETRSVGWKMHINVMDDYVDTKTRQISEFLSARNVTHKVGTGGDFENGKGMTVYCGSKDKMMQVADELVTQGFDGDAPKGDTLGDDMPVLGNLMGRFEITLLSNPQYEWAIGCFSQGSFFGVPVQMKQIVFDANGELQISNPTGGYYRGLFNDTNNEIKLGKGGLRRNLARTAHLSLISIFKEFYYGDGQFPIDVTQDNLKSLLERRPIAYGGFDLPKFPEMSPSERLAKLIELKKLTPIDLPESHRLLSPPTGPHNV